jgi:predicted nuclease with RNAse H fold
MKFVLDSNAARIKSNQSMMIDWHGLRRAVPTVQYITRRYKAVGVNVVETHPLNQVPDVIKGQSNWQNHYKTLKGA